MLLWTGETLSEGCYATISGSCLHWSNSEISDESFQVKARVSVVMPPLSHIYCSSATVRFMEENSRRLEDRASSSGFRRRHESRPATMVLATRGVFLSPLFSRTSLEGKPVEFRGLREVFTSGLGVFVLLSVVKNAVMTGRVRHSRRRKAVATEERRIKAMRDQPLFIVFPFTSDWVLCFT
ncbi:hypothetical protein YC2023_058995 [Brassica napus]